MKTLYLIILFFTIYNLTKAQCGSIISIDGCGPSYAQSVTLTGSGNWNTSFCGYSTPGKEQVYSFVAPTSGVYSIYVTSAPSYYVDFGWQMGTCQSTGWTCFADINSTGQYGSAYWTAGNTYYILLDAEGTGSYSLTFYITCAVPPPSNDECVNAIPLTVGASCSYTNTTNANATASAGIPNPGCANYLGGDVWYSLTVPASGRIIIDSQEGTLTDGGMAIYTGTCSSLTLLECDDDDSDNGLMPKIERSGLTPGSTLYIRFWEYGNNNNGTFSICAYDPPTGPCASITNIASCGTSITASTASGSGSWNSGICGTGTPGRELIYSFTPSVSGIYFLRVTSTGGSNMSYYIQPNTCQSTGWSCIARVTAPNSYPLNLTAGITYYILIDDEDASASTHQFSISCPETPGNYLHPTQGLQNTHVGACMVNTCTGTYKDDGNTANYSPNINQVYRTFCPDQNNKCLRATITEFILEGGSGCPYDWLIVRDGPTQGSPLLWGACGNWSGSLPIELTATNSSGCLTFQFKSDATYQYAGWTILLSCVDCANNPYTNNDCVSATAICGATNMNASSPGPGITSTCGGCNLSENYSSWYYFEITNSGKLALDIKPENFFEDYDFALYRATSCASLGDPVRCSYAMAPSYCYSVYWWNGCSPSRYISNVTFNTINNTTGSNGYANYKSTQQTTVTKGSTYTISVTVAGGNQNYIKVWFDWNKNLSFADAGEEYTIASGVGAGTYSINITIPSTARLGQTGFRVINQRASAPVACPSASCINGEIEDYAIFITDGTHCSNNVLDADETGVDCGGADCVPCSASYWPTNTGMNNIATDVSEDVYGDSWVNWLAVNAGETYYLMVNNWSPGANGFDLVWNFSEGGAMDCSILPVELLNFEAKLTGQNVTLFWETASEINNDYFTIMKSTDAIIYKPIGTIKGAGNSNTILKYSFFDNEPITQLTYYRLKQTDFDGNSTYSEVKAVSPNFSNTIQQFNVFNDVAEENLTITIIGYPHTDIDYFIIDVTGRLVKNGKIIIDENAIGSLKLTTHDLASGIYNVVINNNTYYDQKKIVILK